MASVVHRELGSLPVYVRPGSIIPIEPLVGSTDEKPRGALTLRVFPGPTAMGEFYQDDGSTFAYRSGDFLRMSFTCAVSPGDGPLTMHIGAHEGIYPAWWNEIVVEVNGLTKRPRSLIVNGHNADVQHGSRPPWSNSGATALCRPRNNLRFTSAPLLMIHFIDIYQNVPRSISSALPQQVCSGAHKATRDENCS